MSPLKLAKLLAVFLTVLNANVVLGGESSWCAFASAQWRPRCAVVIKATARLEGYNQCPD